MARKFSGKPIIQFDIYPPIPLVRKRLAAAMVHVANWKPAWWKIAQAFYLMEKRAFATEGVSQGRGWAALDKDYEEWKTMHGFFSLKKLVMTGDLQKSLTQRNAEGAYYESNLMDFAVGSVLPAKGGKWGLGQIHQAGRPDMPARPPLVLDEKFMVVTREIMVRHMMGALKKLDMPLGRALGGL